MRVVKFQELGLNKICGVLVLRDPDRWVLTKNCFKDKIIDSFNNFPFSWISFKLVGREPTLYDIVITKIKELANEQVGTEKIEMPPF